MDTFEAIKSRRAVKHFDPEHRLSEEEITRLMEAAIQSPTPFNMQNWRFVVVTDPELRKQLRAASFDQAQVTDASLLVVMTADLKAWGKAPERYWRDAPPDVGKMLVGWMGTLYDGQEQLERDEAIRSLGIAAQTIMLGAKAMGYDSCPMIGFEPDKVAKLINLPDDHIIGLLIPVGKATKPAWPKPGQLPLEEVVVRDRFAKA
ncbi:MAG: nitroreductase family protein [bacterium]|nr:nitroreductase family protein [bacterium]